MQAEDIVGLAIAITWLAMVAAEALWPGRGWPVVLGWPWVEGSEADAKLHGAAKRGRAAAVENPA